MGSVQNLGDGSNIDLTLGQSPGACPFGIATMSVQPQMSGAPPLPPPMAAPAGTTVVGQQSIRMDPPLAGVPQPQIQPSMQCGQAGQPSMAGGAQMGGPPLMNSQGQWIPKVTRPQMSGVANPPIVANNQQYGPAFQMQVDRRSTADKTAVKYTGFLPLENVYEEDTCRLG